MGTETGHAGWADQLEEALKFYESELLGKLIEIEDLKRQLEARANPTIVETAPPEPVPEPEDVPPPPEPPPHRPLVVRVLRRGVREAKRGARLVARIAPKVEDLLDDLSYRRTGIPRSLKGQEPNSPEVVTGSVIDEQGNRLRIDPPEAPFAEPAIASVSSKTNDEWPERVLIIDFRLPTPDRDCGSLRMLEIIRAMRGRDCEVTFVPDNFFVWPPYLEQLQDLGVEVVHPPAYRTLADYLQQCGKEFELVVISRADIATRHLTTVRRYLPRSKIAFDTVDLHFVREERQAKIDHDPERTAAVARRKHQELTLVRRSDLTIVVSPTELELLERECPGKELLVIPTIYPIEAGPLPGYDDRKNIVFIGGFAHAPNVDAVVYFVREIFPKIRRRLPEAVFQIIGSDPPEPISQLAGEGVEVLGFVADVKPVFDQARASVAPLRFGAGVKGKVNQSMSLGVPAVVTSMAAEGMHLVHGQNAMIADDPASFAQAVIDVWRSPELWRRLSENGLANLRDYFSVEAAAGPIDDLLRWSVQDQNQSIASVINGRQAITR